MTDINRAVEARHSQRRGSNEALRSWHATDAGLDSLEHLRDAEPANLGEGIAKAILRARRPDAPKKETD